MEDRILIVDDDELLLMGLRRQLAERFDLTLAHGGVEAIAEVKTAQETSRPFAVVVCDMRMPELDGLQTLRRIHDIAPETVLLMLTGNTDQKTAIDAINEGHVHRFLTKPCPTDILESNINEARSKYHQVLGERDLLERTLAGSVKVLVDLISINDPVTADLAMRIRTYVGRLSEAGAFPRRWQLNISSSLALIGQMALPPELLRKKRGGEDLSSAERLTIQRAPELARNLIVNIPRLGKVAETVYLQDRGYDGSGFPEHGPAGEDIPMDARIIKILKDLAEVTAETGITTAEAFGKLEGRTAQYDPKLLSAIRACLDTAKLDEAVQADVAEAAAGDAEDPAIPVIAAAKAGRLASANAGYGEHPPHSPTRRRTPRLPEEKRHHMVAVVAVVVIAALALGSLKRYWPRDSGAETNAAQIDALVDQMDAATKGTVVPTNVFGGTITVKNGTVEVRGVPRSACVQASWQLGRRGVLAINGVLAQRLTGSFIARTCRSQDGNVLSWSSEGSD